MYQVSGILCDLHALWFSAGGGLPVTHFRLVPLTLQTRINMKKESTAFRLNKDNSAGQKALAERFRNCAFATHDARCGNPVL